MAVFRGLGSQEIRKLRAGKFDFPTHTHRQTDTHTPTDSRKFSIFVEGSKQYAKHALPFVFPRFFRIKLSMLLSFYFAGLFVSPFN